MDKAETNAQSKRGDGVDILIRYRRSNSEVVVELPKGSALYMSISDAAHLAGVSAETMRSWVETKLNPIPHIVVEKAANRNSKRLVNMAAVPSYCAQQEVGS